jgi:DNA-binding cell septation regulator SpoVG
LSEIKIIEFRLLNTDKPLRAFADIQIGDWIIREWRIIKENGKRPWVAPPQLSWKESESGQIKYKTIITLPDELKGEIDRIILNHFTRETEQKDARQ